MNNLSFHINCKCGGSLRFDVDTVSHEKQYICPNCSANLGAEVLHVLVPFKEFVKHQRESCTQLNNVSSVYMNGPLI